MIVVDSPIPRDKLIGEACRADAEWLALRDRGREAFAKMDILALLRVAQEREDLESKIAARLLGEAS